MRLKTIVDVNLDKAKEIANIYGIEQVTDDFESVLLDKEIDVIDIVTPPYLHMEFALQGLKANKHVICEKPLTGYFGEEHDPQPIGKHVSKRKMYDSVLRDIEKIKQVASLNNKKFFYAENYIYSPNVLKTAEIIQHKKNKLLFMKGEESVRGSSSPVAGEWNKVGGGSWMRIGCHPLASILWLKKVEAEARGENITVQSVAANMGNIAISLTDQEKRHLTSKPKDVEDFANVTVTFSDNTKAVIMASDHVHGGTKNYIELYANDGAMMCQITPTNNMETYFLDDEGLGEVYFSEMLDEKRGWNQLFVAEEILRGYTGELQDFIECIAFDRTPLADIELACETTKVMYAAYVASSEEKTFYFDHAK